MIKDIDIELKINQKNKLIKGKKSMKKFLLFILPIIFIVGCSNKMMMFSKNQESNASNLGNKKFKIYKYKIKIYDRIGVLFYGHPELSTIKIGSFTPKTIGILVNSDGCANFPLVGKIKVAGMYEEDLANYLEKKYSKYIKNPQIIVHVLNKKIIVLGAVKNPGIVKITNETMNIFQAIAERGGMSKIGKRDGVIIIRGNIHNPKISLVDLTNINTMKTKNLTLYPGNIVYVTPNVNLLIGQGLTPAQILNLVLNSAVSMKTLGFFK